MKLNKIHHTMIGLIILLSSIYTLMIVKDKMDLNEDLTKWYADQITANVSTDEGRVVALMHYVYEKGLGVCVQKSFMFEMLLKSEGFKTRHVVLRCGENCSHATTQVKLNGGWEFYDAYYNKHFTNEEYKLLGFDNAFTHTNCIDGSCSNIYKVTYIYTLLTNKLVYREKI